MGIKNLLSSNFRNPKVKVIGRLCRYFLREIFVEIIWPFDIKGSLIGKFVCHAKVIEKLINIIYVINFMMVATRESLQHYPQ